MTSRPCRAYRTVTTFHLRTPPCRSVPPRPAIRTTVIQLRCRRATACRLRGHCASRARAGDAWPWRHHRRALAIYLRTGRGRMALAPMSPYTPLRFTGSGKGSLVSDLPPARPLRQCARWGIHTLARRAGVRRLYAAAVSHMPRQTEQAEQAEHTAQRDWRYARLRAAQAAQRHRRHAGNLCAKIPGGTPANGRRARSWAYISDR